jgi:acyl transferase domain-containing protein
VITVGPRPADAVPFDVLPPLVPLEPERFMDLVVRGQRLRVVDPDTLIRLKLRAGSSHDLHDVAILANLHRDWMEHALALAVSHGKEMGERLATLIRDPRVRGQAKEAQRQDRALQAFARRSAKRTPGGDSST